MQEHKTKIGLLFVALLILSSQSFAQKHIRSKDDLTGKNANVIPTAVPFLLIAPDPRGGALGDAGGASEADANSAFYNPAKFPFAEKDMGVSLSYSPWLRNLVPDITLAYLAGYKKLGEYDVIAASLRYFSLGEIPFVDEQNYPMGDYKPNEFAIDATYSRKLTDDFSMALTGRFINSDLTQGQNSGSVATHPGRAGAVDLGFYYQTDFNAKRIDNLFAVGLNFSNMGSRIAYTDSYDGEFLPANMRLAFNYSLDIDKYNRISFMLDINKLMVPTPPVYAYTTDSLGQKHPEFDANGDPVIAAGEPTPNNVVKGIFQSFSDAPGGFKEELHELSYSAGVEYWYAKQFAVRAGYFYEHPTKGGRKYFTLGLGLRYNVFGLDLSYLIPVASHSPLQNTLRFALLFSLDKQQKTKTISR